MIQFVKFNTQEEKAVLFDGSKPYVHWSEPISTGFISYMNIYWVSDGSSHNIEVEEGGPFSLLNINSEQWTCPGDITWNVLKDPIYKKTITGQEIDGQYWYQLQILINSDVAGEYVCDLTIDNDTYSIGAQIYAQDESLQINLANKGFDPTNLIARAIYEVDPHNESPDYVLLNRKFKELLTNYMDIHANKGSYNSLFNSLKWFEYGNLAELREVWRFLTPDGAKYFDRDIKQWFTEEVRRRYFNSARTTSFALRHMINQIDRIDRSDENLVKLIVIVNDGVKEIEVEMDGNKYVYSRSKVMYVKTGVKVAWRAIAEEHYNVSPYGGQLVTKNGENIINPIATPVMYTLQVVINEHVKRISVRIKGETTIYDRSTSDIKVPYDTLVEWWAEADEFYNMDEESGSLRIKTKDNIISPTAKPNLYELKIIVNSNVLNIDVNGGDATGVHTKSTSIMLPYGTPVSWTAKADINYAMKQSSGSLTIKAGENIISPEAIINVYDLTIIVNNGVQSISVNGGAATGTYTSGKSVITLPFGTPVSWTATASEHYSMDQQSGSLTIKAGDNIISPTANQSEYPLHIVLNEGVESIKITTGAVGTYSVTTTKWLKVGTNVNWLATPQTSYALNSAGGTVVIIAGDNYISPIATFSANSVVTPEFEYANITIYWYDGRDLDIFAGIIQPQQFVAKDGSSITFETRGDGVPGNQYLGWAGKNKYNQTSGIYVKNNFAEWILDDTSTGSASKPGVEGVYLNFSKEEGNITKKDAGLLFNDGIASLLKQGINEIRFDLWAHWYGAKGVKDVKIDFELFKGGKMVRKTQGSGGKYINEGGECVMEQSKMVKAPVYQTASSAGQANLMFTLRYNINTGQAVIQFGE